MSKTRHADPSRAIGRTLRLWREERGLTLQRVAEVSRGFSESIGFEYLSRLERGQLMPSIPKLATLAQVYERPISQLIDLYEVSQLRGTIPRKASYSLLHDLGLRAYEKGEIHQMLACFLGALDAAIRDAEPVHTLATAYNNVGHALMRTARYLTARGYLEEGLRIVERPRTKALIMDNLALVNYQLDNLEIAEMLARQALAIAVDEEQRGSILGTLASIRWDRSARDEAASLTRQAIEILERTKSEQKVINQIGILGERLVRLGRVEEGLVRLHEATARAAEISHAKLRANHLFMTGRSLYEIGRKEDAVAPLKQSLRIALDHEYRNEVFHSAFYLWQLMRESGSTAEEKTYEELALKYRVRLEQRSDEVSTFDSWLAQRRLKARGRKNVQAP